MRNTFLTVLENERVLLRPAVPADHDALFRAANDPLIWEQHNAHDRWKPGVFREFFTGGIENDLGCLIIIDKSSGQVAGSSRYYRYDSLEPAVRIGYTFISRNFWGSGLNAEVKLLMLEHAFTAVEAVYFDIYEKNFRSQKAVAKLGATLHRVQDDKQEWILTRAAWQGYADNL